MSTVKVHFQSMTGYGRASASSNNFQALVELRSVNGRFLDIRSKMPRSLQFIETQLRELIVKEIHRGVLDMQISIQSKNADELVGIDTGVVAAYAKQVEELSQKLGIPSGLNLVSLLRLPAAVCLDESLATEKEREIAQLVAQVLAEALVNLKQSRTTEGRRLGELLEREIAGLRAASANVAKELGPGMVKLQKKLEERVAKLLNDSKAQLDPQRLVQEIAFYADRSDVTEEMDRLNIHIDELENVLTAPKASAGKRLDFLLQEMGREINTLGSKADILEIATHVVEMKLAVEKMREQVQNIE